jgi:hypothetical protein
MIGTIVIMRKMIVSHTLSAEPAMALARECTPVQSAHHAKAWEKPMEDDAAMLSLIEWAERLLDEMDVERETTFRSDDGTELSQTQA